MDSNQNFSWCQCWTSMCWTLPWSIIELQQFSWAQTQPTNNFVSTSIRVPQFCLKKNTTWVTSLIQSHALFLELERKTDEVSTNLELQLEWPKCSINSLSLVSARIWSRVKQDNNTKFPIQMSTYTHGISKQRWRKQSTASVYLQEHLLK